MANTHPKYVCSLTEATRKKALDELNEDPKNRQGAIDTFREWILQQKHLKCPTDNEFLLPFLRSRYFSQLEARTLLENFLKRRTKQPRWSEDIDIGMPDFIDFINIGNCLILPKRDKEGRRILMFRPARAYGSKFYGTDTAYRLVMAVTDYMSLLDEETQVHGVVIVTDMTNTTLTQEAKVNMEDRKAIMKMWQSSHPIRIKAFHIFNAGPLMEMLTPFIKLVMTEKMQKRLFIHGKNLESLYKHVPQELLPEDYLEDDYEGPSAGSIKSIVESMSAEFTKPEVRKRIRYLTSKDFKINLKEKDQDVPQASFRKLSVD